MSTNTQPEERGRQATSSREAAGPLFSLPSPGRVRGGPRRWRAAGFVQHHGLNRSCSEVLGLTDCPFPPHPQVLAQTFHTGSPWNTNMHFYMQTTKKAVSSPNRGRIWKPASVAHELKQAGNKRLPRSGCPESWGELRSVSPRQDIPGASASTAVLVTQQHKGKPRAWIPQTGCDLWHLQCWIPQLLIDCSVTHFRFAIQLSSCTGWWSLIKAKIYRANFSFYRTHCAF